MHDLAAGNASSRRLLRQQSGGNAKADEGVGTVGNFLADELVEPATVPTTSNGFDLLNPRGDARLGAKASHGEDEARALSLPAHIPTKTDVVFEAFRLR
jgi:hypothetical protein